MKPFDNLTATGRLRRLRQVALAALEQYDLAVARVGALAVETNTLFLVETAADRYVLRINAPEQRTPLEIRSELAWLAALGRDTPLLVPRPIPARTGELMLTVETAAIPQTRHCVLFSWVPGRMLGERIGPVTAQEMGSVLARLHQHADSFRPPVPFSTTRLDTPWTFGYPAALNSDAPDPIWPDRRRRLVAEMGVRVQALLDLLYATPEDIRFLHIDFHPGNLKRHAGTLAVLDFDDSRWAHPIQDIGNALFYLLDEPNYARLRASFLSGYQRIRPAARLDPGQLDLCIAARQLDLLSYVLAGDIMAPADLASWLERVEQRLRKLAEVA